MDTMNSKSNGSMSQTMYNLHNKRTLPRDVIKWMQGLDLSYSVKDYRKDMSNGFLIAEIISRYQPGKIPMHAFQNSQNQSRRDNNWGQLHLFFSKQNLKGIEINQDQYIKIMSNNDSKSQNLYNFICRLYIVCTKRSLPQNAPVLDLPPTQTNNPNLTASYLLKDQGLQKLDHSGFGSGNNSQLNHSGISQKNQDRVPTRKIAPNVDTSNIVDAVGVGIRNQGRKMTSKRKSWNMQHKDESYSQQNAEDNKLIFDYLHQILQQCLPQQDPSIRQLIFPDNSKFSPTQILKKSIASVDLQYLRTFISQISSSINELIPILLRQINQTWKFFTYFLRLLRNFQDGSHQLNIICQLLSQYACGCHQRQSKRLNKVFYQSLLDILIAQVKASTFWRKKQKIMMLIYDFVGRQAEEKKVVLAKLKDILGSHETIYIQWLAVLIRQQTSEKNSINSKLIQDFVYYAHQYINSSNVSLRTASLKILSQISKTTSLNLIENYFISKAKGFRQTQSDPEQIYLLVQIFYNILKNIIDSKQYQSLIKGVGSNNLVKAYNPDNQKNAQELKNKLKLVAETIYILSSNTPNINIKEICAKKSINFLSESKFIMLIFLQFMGSTQNQQQFFKQQNLQYEFKSLTTVIAPINANIIKQYSNQILAQIISLKTNRGEFIQNFVFLVNMCLQNLNVKKVNMEFWEDVSIHIIKTYTKFLVNSIFSKGALIGIKHIFLIYFNYDMKIRELNQWLSQQIVRFYRNQKQISQQISQNSIAQVEQSVVQLNKWLNNQYQKSRNELIRFTITQISQLLQEQGLSKIICLNN